MKNILFIQHSPLLGGASNALVDILESLDKARYKAVVLCVAEGPTVDRIRAIGIKVYIKKFGTLPNYAFQEMSISWDSLIRILKFLVLLPISSFSILKILIAERIHLVYINSLISIGCSFIPKLLGISIIIHFREFPIMNRFGRLQHRLAKRVSVQIICASNAIRLQILPIIPNSLVIYDWVDTKEFDKGRFGNSTRKKWGIPDDRICIGMVSALSEAKGIFVFFEAANILLNQGRRCTFVYVGGFPNSLERERLLYMIDKSHYKSSFFLTGWTYDVAAALAAMDIVVSPNIKAEGFGKTVVEAGAMHKPIVASNLLPIDELVVDGETGLLVEANKAEVLAEAIEFLIDKPSERERLGKNARRWINMHFSMDKNVNRILETMDNVLSRRIRSRGNL